MAISERNWYENFWAGEEEPLAEKERDRIGVFLPMIPANIKTILDLGCGDGRISNILAERFDTTPLDFSLAALRKCRGRAVCADSGYLPFSSHSFDLVLCTELLEHLDDATYRRTTEDIQRTSKQFILVSVPYRENLRLQFVKCESCGTVFHRWMHLRSFSRRTIRHLFLDFEMISMQFHGEREPYHNRLVLIINQKLGNRWARPGPNLSCPSCGNQQFTRTPRNLFSIGCGLMNLTLARLVPGRQGQWVFALYRRRLD